MDGWMVWYWGCYFSGYVAIDSSGGSGSRFGFSLGCLGWKMLEARLEVCWLGQGLI